MKNKYAKYVIFCLLVNAAIILIFILFGDSLTRVMIDYGLFAASYIVAPLLILNNLANIIFSFNAFVYSKNEKISGRGWYVLAILIGILFLLLGFLYWALSYGFDFLTK